MRSSSTSPDLLYEGIAFSSLDEAVERMRAFARAHSDFEPSLVCGRAADGRRRWELTVAVRTNGGGSSDE